MSPHRVIPAELTKTRPNQALRYIVSGAILLALVVVSSMLFAARSRFTAAEEQQHLVVKAHLTDLLSSVRQGESGVRGYLLTGNGNSVVTYNLSLQALPPTFSKLDAELTSGPEHAQLATVHQVTTQKLRQLAQAIALYQAGDHPGAAALVNADLNLHTMQNLRDLIGAMQASESASLQAAQAEDEADTWLLQFAIGIAVLATILVAFFAIRESRLQSRDLQRAQAALLNINAALENKVAERTATLRASQAELAQANASLEQRVAERSAELERIFRLSTDILAVIDFDGRFVNVSPAWETITGWTIAEALARPFGDFLHPDDIASSHELFEKISKGAPVIDFENRYRRADGSYCWLSWRSVPQLKDRLVFNVARDVTQEKARDEQLRQSQKMEVVGQLTGGIAHDFNNLLTIIMGSLEMLKRGLPEATPKLLSRVDSAMDGAKRAAALTHRLLAFSRRQPLAPKPVEINRLVAGMSDMLHRTLGETVAVELVTGAGLWPAMADINQLENALLNLAVNARDAMPNGGYLTIETQNSYLDDAYTEGQADVAAGQYVQVSVTDTGTGMAPAVREKVFEPFFTTKPQGQGTGLGLAQVYGFIKQSGGHVAIYSELGHGTTVKLYLPRLRAAASASAEPTANDSDNDIATAARGRGETILLVEDENGVREFAGEILAELGYKVIAADNAAAALELFDGNPGIKMLFTDVVLTGPMNGRRLADEILRRAPATIILFTTGYTRNAIIHHGRLDDGINFIGKPFTAAALGHTIRKLLDQPQKSAAE